MTAKKCNSNSDKLRFINFVDMRAYFETVLAEREKQIALQFSALRESVTAAFAAAEKASTKSEQAQERYNVAHNDLLHKMDKQAEEFMTRREYTVSHEALRSEIAVLREFKVSEATKAALTTSQQTQRHWGIEMWIVAVAGAAGWITLIIQHFLH